MARTERPDFYALIAKNRRATWGLMVAFFLLLTLVGVVIAGLLGGGIIAFVIAIALSTTLAVSSYFSSATIALQATRAKPASREEFGRLHNLVEEIAIAAAVTPPKVYVVHDPAPNAFATGRNPDNAAIAVTTGLLDKMNRAELQGVIAHEMAHIRNYDIRVMTVAVATAGSIAIIADLFWRMLYFGALTGGGASHRRGNQGKGGGGSNPIAIFGMLFVAVLAPIAAALLKAAISRQRESLADATAVEFTRYPTGLRRALEKLDADITVVRHTSHATSHLWVEAPDDTSKSARGNNFNKMFSTHPPLRERIDLLRAMEGLPPYQGADPDVAEALRTMQDDRTEPRIGIQGAALAPDISDSRSAAASVDLRSIFDGAGEVAGGATDASAGWYADPSGDVGFLRYWDGSDWTDHRHRIPDHNSLSPSDARRTRRRRRRGGHLR